jgi:hypothetical protein
MDQQLTEAQQFARNLQVFLAQVRVSANTEEERNVLQVYGSVGAIVEQLATGQLVIVTPDQVKEPEENNEE